MGRALGSADASVTISSRHDAELTSAAGDWPRIGAKIVPLRADMTGGTHHSLSMKSPTRFGITSSS